MRTRIATRDYPSVSSSYQDIPIVNCENPQRIILYVFTIADSHRLWNHKVTDRDTINLFTQLYFNINKNHYREDIIASSLIVSYSVTIFTSTHSGPSYENPICLLEQYLDKYEDFYIYVG